jgi:flagellar basal-body rod modification protein FlgD
VNQQISESTFLQLLVAQLQNQDPLQPMDGMQFVTQLAQFSQLESIYGIQSDTDKLVADATTSSSSATSSTTGS